VFNMCRFPFFPYNRIWTFSFYINNVIKMRNFLCIILLALCQYFTHLKSALWSSSDLDSKFGSHVRMKLVFWTQVNYNPMLENNNFYQHWDGENICILYLLHVHVMLCYRRETQTSSPKCMWYSLIQRNEEPLGL